MARRSRKVTANSNFTGHSPARNRGQSYQFLTLSGSTLEAPRTPFAPLRGMRTMASSRRGFAKERHTVMKSVITGLAVLGFAGGWAGFASAHSSEAGDDFQASPDDAGLVLEPSEEASPTSFPTSGAASAPTAIATSTAAPATATATSTVAAATATATQRSGSPQQAATQPPVVPTSTPVPPSPAPAKPTSTTAVPTATAGAPKPTATKAPKKSRGS